MRILVTEGIGFVGSSLSLRFDRQQKRTIDALPDDMIEWLGAGAA
tara:strand:+ start:2761 stop:2895 length:135 start_codon:yes stop_codon:yes gene_type:complete